MARPPRRPRDGNYNDHDARLGTTFHEDRIEIALIPPTSPTIEHTIYRQGLLLTLPPKAEPKSTGTAVDFPLRAGQKAVLRFIAEARSARLLRRGHWRRVGMGSSERRIGYLAGTTGRARNTSRRSAPFVVRSVLWAILRGYPPSKESAHSPISSFCPRGRANSPTPPFNPTNAE